MRGGTENAKGATGMRRRTVTAVDTGDTCRGSLAGMSAEEFRQGMRVVASHDGHGTHKLDGPACVALLAELPLPRPHERPAHAGRHENKALVLGAVNIDHRCPVRALDVHLHACHPS